MKTNSKFVIGDIQGCYKEFKSLIKLIDPNKEINSYVLAI